MRAILFLLALFPLSAAPVASGASPEAVLRHSEPSPADSDAAITVTVTDTYDITYASNVLDLDWYHVYSTTFLMFTSSSDDKLYFADPGTGAYSNSIDLHSANTSCFGIAFVEEATSYYVTNDASTSSLYRYDSGGPWYVYQGNPAQNHGRGLEYDPGSDSYWETYTNGSTRRLYRFAAGGSADFFPVTQPQSQLSGIAIYPYNSNLGIMIACYDDLHFYFYQYDGASLAYVGSASCPPVPGLAFSYGLTYSSTGLDRFYWSWRNSGGDYFVSELEVDFTADLEPETWGSVKALFADV